MDALQTTTAIVITISPFLPFLLEIGENSAKKLSEIIVEKGGEAAWNKAQSLWTKVKGYFHTAPKIESAAKLVAQDPEDEDSQKVLAKALGSYLQNNPESLEELVELFGGEQSIQEVLADKGSLVENVKQSLVGSGTQRVVATEQSSVKGVTQIKN